MEDANPVNGSAIIRRESERLFCVPPIPHVSSPTHGSPGRASRTHSTGRDGGAAGPVTMLPKVVGGSMEDGIWHTPEELSTIVEASALPEMVIGFDGFDPESKHKAWLMAMDYVQKFDIELDKTVYYAGEVVTGQVVVITTENIKVKGIRLTLRGKAHTEWRINKAGETRTLKDDEYYVDDKKILWGKDKHEDIATSILPRGKHAYKFEFKLPETALPCSFESKIGHVRYYFRVVMDIPYASPPQAIKYFTIVGPHIDCMEDRYLAPKFADDKHRTCCFCCMRGLVRIQATLERSAYCCGEQIRIKTEIQNSNDEPVYLLCKFVQYVEYYMNKGVLGIMKTVSHKVWEYQAEAVRPQHTGRQDHLQDELQVPVLPPTMIDVCGLIQIHYVLKLLVIGEESGELMHLQFPITVGTVPFRIPNMAPPEMMYDVSVDYVEGGKYISSEFQVGQVYMGDEANEGQEEEVLYRPIYSCVPHDRKHVTNTKGACAGESDTKDGKNDCVCEEINVVPMKRKSLTKGKSFRKGSLVRGESKLKPEVVTVDNVSTAEPWEVVALKKD
ncbi:ARRD3-like protein [Mya arenaria]|uniref:ARRD3-like protein n=3 Tax=Mya arenaria TaxID=6604 RepID=A0ABY7FQR0_MYAAR|nr:arrestin domain-containing protein 3-like isoform X2 [Mya arenaria]XP_052776903.1 arrestin domain-containing protein 3-like isoform X2 [Mya arenaria]XP_052776904.1 arrestin domain-containing protein 3-like isoform X2 [Mya arenaria]XP_052776905.1 arrestin domain-containing protein 3-like isoform X2 [Mya arenaria]WAR23382.1 ARRD3-like protein [Mya arenaria]